MMQDVNVEQTNELRTIEVGQANVDEGTNGKVPTSSTSDKTIVEHHSNFISMPDMSGSDEDEASEVRSLSRVFISHTIQFFI